MTSIFDATGLSFASLTQKQRKLFFNTITKLIYETVSLESVTYQGKTYYERSNMWDSCSTNRPETEHDPNRECNGYWECETADDRIRPISTEPLIYNLEVTGDSDECCDPNKEECVTMWQKLLPIISDQNNWDKFTFDFNQPIVLNNLAGFNDDHRGQNHFKLLLDFHRRWTLRPNCTLKEFIDGMFRIKSHKCDLWYELYCGVNTLKVRSDQLWLHCHFDHGS